MAEFEVTHLYSGSFFYPIPVNSGSSGGGSGGAGAGGFGAGAGVGGGGYSGGYISGSGEIVSDFEGIIYIRYGDCEPYPVYVKPGKNTIYFFIPIILPILTQTDASLTIEAKGTILIPAGFKIIRRAGDTLVPVPSFKIVDKFGMRDLIQLEQHSAPPPVDLDGVIEEYVIEDVTDIEIINATIEVLSGLDDVVISDLVSILHDVPPNAYDSSEVESFDITDNISTELTEAPPTPDAVLDKIIISDKYHTELVSVNTFNRPRVENVNISDVLKIN